MTSAELIAGVKQAGEAFAGFIERQNTEAFHRRPAPEEWTAAELCGHVAEFPTTFARQAREVALHPGGGLGRGLDDPGRLTAVPKLAGAGPVQAAAAVRSGLEEAVALLSSIGEEQWQATGSHPRLGPLTVSGMVEHFILDHLRDHLKQARVAVGETA
ncbi:MAG: DinB family protein [Chloroflexota bacterium]|nr:DinB family protein [Chloroflexota bacterium]